MKYEKQEQETLRLKAAVVVAEVAALRHQDISIIRLVGAAGGGMGGR